MDKAGTISTGVQELIDRLRDDGVHAGQSRAEEIIQDAESKAAQILSNAEKQVREMREKAMEEIQSERDGGRNALQLAARDTILQVRAAMHDYFSAHVRKLTRLEMQDKTVLRQMILAVAGAATTRSAAAENVEIIISGSTDTDRNVQDGKTEPADDKDMDRLASMITGEILRAGFVVKTGTGSSEGLRVRLHDEDLEIDLTDQGVAEFLVRRLSPRFRKITETLEI